MSDFIIGDKVGHDKISVSGHHNALNISNPPDVRPADLDAAIAELRSLIAQLSHDGVVDADGTITDPGAVIAAVETQPGRFKALGKAITGGAKDAILSVVQGSVAEWIVALLGRN
jgi:hypothetical protein